MKFMNPMGDNPLGKFLGLMGTSALVQVTNFLAVVPTWAGDAREYVSMTIWVIGVVGTILYACSLFLDIEKKIKDRHDLHEAKLKAIKIQIEEETCNLRRLQGRCPFFKPPNPPDDKIL